jgi:hypothetical protein
MLVQNRLAEAAAVPQEEADLDCHMQQLPIHEPQRWTLWNASQLPLDQPHLRDLVSWYQIINDVNAFKGYI